METKSLSLPKELTGLSERLTLLRWRSPVVFFTEVTGDAPFSYQKEILKELPNMDLDKFLLCAAGNCIVKGTKISMSDGTFKNVEDVKENDIVLSFKNGKIVKRRVLKSKYSGIKKSIRLKTYLGSKIDVSFDHPILQRNGWRNAEEFTSYKSRHSKYKSISARDFDLPEYDISDEKIILLSRLISEGHYGKRQTPKVTNNNVEYLKKVEDIVIKEFNCKPRWYRKENGFDLVLTFRNYKTSPIIDWLRELGIYEQVKENKEIPQIVFKFSNRQTKLFLYNFYIGDGHIELTKKIHRLNLFPGLSKKLGIQLLLLFSRLGMYGNLRKDKNQYWVRINRFKSWKEFENNRNTSEWTKIIKDLGEREVYDLTIEETECFISQGFVVHNTGKTRLLADIALWSSTILSYIILKQPYSVIIESGSQEQSRILYDYLKTWIENNDILSKLVKGEPLKTNTEFKNTSFIKALPASWKSIFGQHANLVLIDEAVEAGEDLIEDSLRVVATHKPSRRIFSSTPHTYNSKFVDMWEKEDEYKDWKRYSWSALDCPLYTEKVIEEARKKGDMYFNVFYLGKPYALIGTVIPIEKIKNCSRGVDLFTYEKDFGYSVMGIDWGWAPDPTAISIIQRDDEQVRLLYYREKLKEDPEVAVNWIENACKEYNIDRIQSDSHNKHMNALVRKRGLPLFEISFKGEKGMMQSNLTSLFEREVIRIPEQFVRFNWQLRQYTYNTKGSDDLVDSLLLACRQYRKGLSSELYFKKFSSMKKRKKPF